MSDDEKRHALKQIVRQRGLTQAFVFVNSKLGCARLARSLEREGMNTTALHGDKSQDERLKALDAFKQGEVDLLVATDVAARGLDIKDVPAVFNFDVPFNAEDYVHRIGRTGRAGAVGPGRDLRFGQRRAPDRRHREAAQEQDRARSRSNSTRTGRAAASTTAAAPGAKSAKWAIRATCSMRRASASAAAASAARVPPARRAPRDPFFDQPYQAPATEAPPAWEAAAKPAASRVSRPTSRPSARSRRCSRSTRMTGS